MGFIHKIERNELFLLTFEQFIFIPQKQLLSQAYTLYCYLLAETFHTYRDKLSRVCDLSSDKGNEENTGLCKE